MTHLAVLSVKGGVLGHVQHTGLDELVDLPLLGAGDALARPPRPSSLRSRQTGLARLAGNSITARVQTVSGYPAVQHTYTSFPSAVDETLQ